jgi:hypothetical protein
MSGMFGNRGNSAEEKRQEALSAYLDNTLSAAERARFEKLLAGDAELRAQLEQIRTLKVHLRSMPRRRVPRSFALDPARYGRPKRQPMLRLYPLLRGATALTAVLLIFTLALGAFVNQDATQEASAPAVADVAIGEAVGGEIAPAEESAPLPAAATPDSARSIASPSAEKQEAPLTELAIVEGEETANEESAEFAAGAAEAATGVPEGDFQLESAEVVVEQDELPADTPLATEMAAPEEAAPVTSVEIAADASVGEDEEQINRVAPESLLGPVQIVLAAAFLTLFILWLIVRRRIRSL